jgi:dihydroxyacetone kinase-like protein
VNLQALAAMLGAAADRLKANQDLLTQLDSATGDGDHGTTMGRVADALLEAAGAGTASSVKELLDAAGWAVLCVDGGSASPLTGSFLSGMADGSPAAANLNPQELASAFAAGLAKFRAQTPAQVGDKTMLDALAPAVDALQSAADQGLGPAAMMARAAEAAQNGAENTRSLQAKFGRARNLGPRSIGSVDPGAVSISLLFAGFSSALADRE